uniref:Uncharacterized protein n=1 Tax=Chromera velia CCMP2878 TaxID=1169474 RepID=A0A0G4G1N3_9ALVE|eukprot:Cvel_19835.t1-p1 / transcript=Cvel_19835.t1 / gene=Cvel_19835 / organism=Chromera_velia_CCMP2878 / gene_product=hypothetical protein / transcript_product=hypothetical protein / location=Cvel_scaffold1736:17523-17795(+) / protein_length=91 / sequence_SO=supercontig / SO=protein_coding / is_pseudo=false
MTITSESISASPYLSSSSGAAAGRLLTSTTRTVPTGTTPMSTSSAVAVATSMSMTSTTKATKHSRLDLPRSCKQGNLKPPTSQLLAGLLPA